MDEEPPVTKLTLTPSFVRSLTSLLGTDMEGVVSHFLGDADETDAMAVSNYPIKSVPRTGTHAAKGCFPLHGCLSSAGCSVWRIIPLLINIF